MGELQILATYFLLPQIGPSPSADLHLLHGASHIDGVDDESRMKTQKRAKRKAGEDVGDEEWYRLPSQKLTPQLKQELRLLKVTTHDGEQALHRIQLY